MATTGINTVLTLVRFRGAGVDGDPVVIDVNDGSVSSVLRTAAGNYDVTFVQPTDPTKRIVVCAAELAAPGGFVNVTAWNVDNDVATVQVRDAGGALVEPVNVALRLENGEAVGS